MSLFPIVVHTRGAAAISVVNWLRFVQTVSLVWLVPYALRKLRDVELLLGVTALALTLEIGGATLKAVLDGSVDTRFRLAGGNSVNSTGLLAALLILMSFHSPVPRRRSLRITMLVVGIPGLVLAKSLGSIAAVAVTLAIFGFHRPGSGRSRPNAGLLMPTRVLLIALAALAVAGLVKGQNLPGSPDFNQSSTVHRAILATAGLELFADHPLTGIGWQSAASPEEARRINDRLKRLFGNDVNQDFYPEGATSDRIFVHNAVRPDPGRGRPARVRPLPLSRARRGTRHPLGTVECASATRDVRSGALPARVAHCNPRVVERQHALRAAT